MHKHNIIYPYVRKGALVLHLAPLVCLVPPCFSVIIYISFPPICGVEGSYWRALQRCSSTRPKRECEDEGLSRQNEWAPPIVSRQNEQRKTCVMAQAGPLTVTRPALPTPAISILKPACRQGLLASLSLSISPFIYLSFFFSLSLAISLFVALSSFLLFLRSLRPLNPKYFLPGFRFFVSLPDADLLVTLRINLPVIFIFVM